MQNVKTCKYPGCTEPVWLSGYCRPHNYEKRRERMRKLYHERGGTRYVICTVCQKTYVGGSGTKYCPNCRDKIRKINNNNTSYHGVRIDGTKFDEHRLIAKQVGAITQKDDVVHHTDGNKANNDPSNLVVLSLSNHTKLHRYLEVEHLRQPNKSTKQISWEFIWQNYIPYCFCNEVPGYHFPIQDCKG